MPNTALDSRKSVNLVGSEWLQSQLCKIEDRRNEDLLAIISPIYSGLDERIRIGIESLEPRRGCLLVILNTQGGLIEVVERCVKTIRHHYSEVKFLVPDVAMSAGTIFVMSGDAILMDYYSCLGPIDPQVLNADRRWVPATSYISQFDKLCEKSQTQSLSQAEIILLSKLDLAELQTYRQQAELSTDLIKEWLANYKFKDWKTTECQGLVVTPEMRKGRAEEIANKLNNHELWKSHSRGIGMDTLTEDLNLRITDYSADPTFHQEVRQYFSCLMDFMASQGMDTIVHTSGMTQN